MSRRAIPLNPSGRPPRSRAYSSGMKPLQRLAVAALAALAALPFGGCAKNAATGRTQLNFLSRDDEIALGREAAPELVASYGGEIPDAQVAQYVQSVGMRLAEGVEEDYRGLPWKFTLLNSTVINAFALPGGQVFISRELASRFANEAELAGVLGHEIGHVTAEHADRSIGTQLGLQVVALGVSILVGNDTALQLASQAVVTGAGVYALTFSRDQETEADRLGMRYMTQAGYDPSAMLSVMQVLAAASEGNAQWEILSTHPAPESRIKDIRKLLQRKKFREAAEGSAHQLYTERYQQQLLEPLRRLPPAPRAERFDLSAPQTWCAHCAAGAALAQAR